MPLRRRRRRASALSPLPLLIDDIYATLLMMPPTYHVSPLTLHENRWYAVDVYQLLTSYYISPRYQYAFADARARVQHTYASRHYGA